MIIQKEGLRKKDDYLYKKESHFPFCAKSVKVEVITKYAYNNGT